MAKISRNPQIAYNQGVAKGEHDGYIKGGAEAIQIARSFNVLALYNIVHNFVKSEKKQREMLKAYHEEQERIYMEEFSGNTDQVMLAMKGVEKIYKEIGIELEVNYV